MIIYEKKIWLWRLIEEKRCFFELLVSSFLLNRIRYSLSYTHITSVVNIKEKNLKQEQLRG